MGSEPNPREPDQQPCLCFYSWECCGVLMPDVRSSGSAEGTQAGLELHRNIAGRIFAGTPIAVQPAGTSLITNELAAIVASSPIVTAPMMLA
jgi:hypothetical protein